MDDDTRAALAAQYPQLTPSILNLISGEAYDRGHSCGQAEVNSYARDIASFASEVLKEHQNLVKAAKALHEDLLQRGERDDDGVIVVNASFGRWKRFCDALEAVEP